MTRRRKLSKAERLNRAIDLWQRKQEGAVVMLRRSAEMLARLHRQRRRLLASQTHSRNPVAPGPEVGEDPQPGPAQGEAEDRGGHDDHAVPQHEPGAEAPAVGTGHLQQHDDGIPDFLRRQAIGKAKDAAFAARVAQEQAELKQRAQEKAQARRKAKESVRDAELTGKRRKMPLQGKAALKHIQGAC